MFFEATLPNGLSGTLVLEKVDNSRLANVHEDYGPSFLAIFQSEITPENYARLVLQFDENHTFKLVAVSAHYTDNEGIKLSDTFQQLASGWSTVQLGSSFDVHMKHDSDYMKQTKDSLGIWYFSKSGATVYTYNPEGHKSEVVLEEMQANKSYSHLKTKCQIL